LSTDEVYTIESIVSPGDVVGEVRESIRAELREQLVARWREQNPGRPEPTAYDRLEFSLDAREYNDLVQAVAFVCAQKVLAIPSRQTDRERELGELADRARAQVDQLRSENEALRVRIREFTLAPIEAADPTSAPVDPINVLPCCVCIGGVPAMAFVQNPGKRCHRCGGAEFEE
jgi:hypothetical protein